MLIFQGFTPLDAVRPYQAMSQFPAFDFSLVVLKSGHSVKSSATIMQAQNSITEI
jgi:hypothetical protein